PDVALRRILHTTGADYVKAAWSSESRALYIAFANGRLERRPTHQLSRNDRSEKITLNGERLVDLKISPNGRRLAVASESTLTILDEDLRILKTFDIRHLLNNIHVNQRD